jgi:hypothetical protein
MIEKLVSLWYQCLVDHHKDKDCHWYIGCRYSYSGEKKYYVNHEGYLLGFIWENFNSYEDAEKFLIQTLKEAIKKEATGWIETEDDFITDETKDHLKNVLKELQKLSEEN